MEVGDDPFRYLNRRVRGFQPFVGRNKHVLYDVYKLRNCTLVVDASNLINQLAHNPLWLLGVKLELFSSRVRRFFDVLTESKVTPILVLNGPDNEFKEDRHMNNLAKQMNAVNVFNKNKSQVRNSGSRMASHNEQMIFRDIAKHLGIAMIQPMKGGGFIRKMAAYAGQRNLPMLSWNNDLYFLDLGGAEFVTAPIGDLLEVEKDKDGFYVRVNRYKRQRLLDLYPKSLNNRLVEMAFAILRTKDTVFSDLFDNERWPSVKQVNFVFEFLRAYEHTEAQRRLIEELDDDMRAQAKKEIKSAYSLCKESTRSFEDSKTHSMPLWFQKDFTEGRLPKPLYDIIERRQLRFDIQCEDLKKHTINKPSGRIRKFIYTILLGHIREDKPVEIEEFTRQRQRLHSFNVKLIRTVQSNVVIPTLDEVEKLSKSRSVKLFCEALLWKGTPNLDLAVIGYWIQQSSYVTPRHIAAALLCVISGETHFPQTKSALFRRAVHLRDDFIKEAENSYNAADHLSGSKVSLENIHVFSELIAIIRDAKMLNELLRCPLSQGTDIGHFLNGCFFHNILAKLPCDDSALQTALTFIKNNDNKGRSIFSKTFDKLLHLKKWSHTTLK